jgi:hypothetical protein
VMEFQGGHQRDDIAILVARVTEATGGAAS